MNMVLLGKQYQIYDHKCFGLDLRYLCGQSYDSAGNMAGRYQGAAAIIQQVYPMAPYFHCELMFLSFVLL